MKNMILVSAVAASVALAGCQTTDWGQKETMGGLGGAVLGGLAGSQIGSGSGRLWATGAGVLLGTLIGSEIGRSLDAADRMYMQQAQLNAYKAPIGETVAWSNPESGNSGSYTPTQEGTSNKGRYCREYEQTIYIGGKAETGVGTACQNPDGTWEII
ncbi:MAG: glycine zipper 2TM domain-containing protein [Rhodospirillales bacterium]|nr:glycine zipper 2TM domain-containing protein [Rhodospirillales bacterium]